jgi:hypothetical protein
VKESWQSKSFWLRGSKNDFEQDSAANPAIALLVESARTRCCLSGLQCTRPAGRVAELGQFCDGTPLKRTANTCIAVVLIAAACLPLLCGCCASRTPVLNAAEEGNLEKVKLLLKAGRSINKRNPRVKFGWTPLIAAINQRNINVAHFLISSGADVNIPDNQGETAIMWATVSDENLEIVKDLIAHGADLNAKDKMGASVLSYASADPPKPKLLEAVKSAMAEQEHVRRTEQRSPN